MEKPKTEPTIWSHSNPPDNSEWLHPKQDHPQAIIHTVKTEWCIEFAAGKFHYVEAGYEPNWFHRWMQKIFFGFKWKKTSKTFDFTHPPEFKHDCKDAVIKAGVGGVAKDTEPQR